MSVKPSKLLSIASPFLFSLSIGSLASATPSGQYVTRAVPQDPPGLYIVDFTVYQESPEPPHVARSWERTYRIYCPNETVRNITGIDRELESPVILIRG
ncbi:hypothetical protein [Baaleninema sp.]|uniref:hypothetical protein n=1 Tax=Baaleninema sp. TaxID=3101197 RepID=UPI003D04A714